MFYVPEVLAMRRRGHLPRCWLASNKSEKVFKKAFSNDKIAQVNIVESCEEILILADYETENHQRSYSLRLCSYLLPGVAKVASYQMQQMEKSVNKTMDKLHGDKLEGPERKDKMKATPEFSELELLTPPVPDLRLDRPFPPDVNQLREISPGTHRKMREMEEENLLSIPPLTDAEIAIWLNEDTEPLWPNVEPPVVREFDAVDEGVAGLETSNVILRTPQKRPSAEETLVDTPTKIRRQSLKLIMDAVAAQRAEDDIQAVVPMEEDEPLLLPVDIPEPVLPIVSPVDKTANAVIPAAVPMEENEPFYSVAPIVLLDNQTENANVPAVIPMEEDEPFLRPGSPNVLAGDQTENANIPVVQPVQPAKKRRAKRRTKVDAKDTISDAKRKRREANLQAHSVPASRSMARRVILPMYRKPSTIFKSDMENPRFDRTRPFSIELLYRYEIAIYGPHVVETVHSSTFQPSASSPPREPALQKTHALTVITDKPKNDTVNQHDQEQQNKYTDDNPFDMESGDNILPRGLSESAPLENTSEANTVNIGALQMSSDPQQNGDANRPLNLSNRHMENLDAFLPSALPVDKEPYPTRSAIVGQREWSKKDMEAILEILWRDNNNIINFEQLVPMDETNEADAFYCLMHLLTLYKNGRVKLTQDGTGALIYIEKVERSEPMDLND